jgi:hypothetical protein
MTSTNFENLDLSKYGETAKELIQLGGRLGYRVTQTRSSVCLHSPVQKITVEVPPIRQMNEHRRRAFYEKIIRYGDLDKVRAELRRATKPEVTGAKKAPPPPPTIKRTQPVPGAVYTSESPQPHIVREFPYMKRAKTHSRELIPSKEIRERHWSNGTVDYACTHPGCNFHHSRLQSVSVHFAKATGHNGTWQVNHAAKKAKEAKKSEPLKATLKASAESVKEAVQEAVEATKAFPKAKVPVDEPLAIPDEKPVAQAELTKVVDNVHETNALIVQKVRELVFQGEFDSYKGRIEELMQINLDLATRLEAAEASLKKARDDRRAAAALLAELDD